MSLKDIFKNLKLNVVGTKTSDIDSKLDSAIKDISAYKSQSGRNGYIDLVKSLISKNSSSVGLDSGFGMMSQGPLTPSAMGQGDRLLRYKTYDSILEYINYCKRALDVLTDNILSPDDITKISLDIKPKSFLEDEIPTEAKTSHVKETVKRLKIEKNLGLIVRTTLGMGDFFVEIADSKTAVMSRSIISESEYLNDLKDVENTVDNLNIENYKVKVDFSSISESDEADDKKEMKLEKLVLVFHDPKRVIKLQSEMFPFCFGYLIFPRLAIQPSLSIQDQAINQICTSILKSVEKRVPQIKELSDNEELKKTIEHMLKTSNPSNLSVRFVSADKIQHFQVPSLKYYPYGESIFDSCKFSSKVLIALETALTIHRLNRSTEKRKIGIEVGLPRDSKKLIENIKEELRKRKVSIDTFGTIDTIPSSVTTFEDIYIPMRDGKPYVDISTFNEGGTDVRGKVDELKLLRDQLVASLGIPPAFLGIEEGQTWKTTLSEENTLFARTIIAHQKYLSEQLNELIVKIYQLTNPEEALTLLDNVHISFMAPKSLQFEREARYMGELANLVRTLEEVGIPKEYSKKKYLHGIDWDELENYEIDDTIDKKVGTKKEEEGGMGGGMGGGF